MADTNIVPLSHPYDETGTLPENYIENEMRPLGDRTVRAVAMRFGAFFVEGFKIRDGNGNDVPKSKYQYALYNNTLSAKTGKDVIGAVVITDPTVISPVYIDYHCVGGPWGASNERLIEMFYELMKDRAASWPNILGKPDEYKPAHHMQDIGDLFGAEYIVTALERLASAILMGDSASHDEIWRRMDALRTELKKDLADMNTSLRKYIDDQDAAINESIASLNQRVTNVREELVAADNALGTRITNVQNALQANINAVASSLTSHVNNKNNPHSTTSAQVGTYTSTKIDELINSINNGLDKYVEKHTGEDLSLTSSGGMLYAHVNGGWKVIWPPQWQ